MGNAKVVERGAEATRAQQRALQLISIPELVLSIFRPLPLEDINHFHQVHSSFKPLILYFIY